MKWRAYLDDPALREFAAVEEGHWRVLAKRGCEDWAVAVAAGEAAVTRVVGGGRAEHPVVELPGGGAAVVRRYRRGGMMRHLNRQRYFVGHRAFEELRATARAQAAGVQVPEPIAAAERRRGLGYEALLATRLVEGSVGFDRWLEEGTATERETALRLAGREIDRMHTAGIAHPDLNLRNLLISTSPADRASSVLLIDFDRARLSEGPVRRERRARDLKRLARSARKLELPLGESDWSALRDGYGEDWPLRSEPRP